MKMINKLVGMVAIFMLLVGGVVAGDINDVDVDASFSFRNGLTIEGISGEIDADTLDGMTAEDLTYDDSKVVKRLNNQNKKIAANTEDIEDLGTYVSDNEASYLAGDGNGIGSKTVYRLLDKLKDWIRSLFVTKEYVQTLEKRLYVLENPDLTNLEIAKDFYNMGYGGEYENVKCYVSSLSEDVMCKIN